MAWLTHRWRSEWNLSAVVLVLGVAISAAGALRLRHEIELRANEVFERGVSRVIDDMHLRFGRTVYGLNGARGMYAANSQISRAQFQTYVQSRDLEQEFPGVRGFGLIQRVAREDRDVFVAAERADGAPGFSIRQLVNKNLDDLYVIRFIEPGERNLGALGLDIGSENARRSAAEGAITSGETTLSGNITLVQDNKRSSGALLFVPLYRSGMPIGSPEQRAAAQLGLLYAPIVFSELLEGIHDVAADQLGFTLFDTTNMSEPIYTTANALSHKAGRAASRLQASRDVTVYGRSMRLQLNSTPAFDAEVDVLPAWTLMLGGGLVSALLSLLMWQQASGRRRAESLAQGMTHDLDRLAQVVRHTSDAVSILDRNQNIEWINEGFTRITGFTAAEALGRTPAALLSSGKAAPESLKTLADAVRKGTGCRVELLNRTKDGRENWVDIEMQPLRDANGMLTGFMEVCSDITERRLAQHQLQAVVRDNQALLNTLDMHAIVSVTDRDGLITEVNDAFCAISGHTREELLGQSHQIVSSGIHDANYWRTMWTTISSGTPWRAEVCNRTKNGALYWVDTFIAPFRGDDGEIEKFISIRIDITASKIAEQDLALERRTLANIIEGTSAGTWEWNTATGETRVNARWAQIGGYTLEDMDFTRFETWEGLIHPDDKARSHELLQRHFNGEAPGYECENRIRHKKGHWVWVLGRGRLLSRRADGSPMWMAGIHLDISQRKQAEQALRESESLMRLVTENMAGRLAYFDKDSRLKFANQATFDFFGGTTADRIGCTFAQLVGPERMQRLGPELDGVLAGDVQSYESENREPDGQTTYSLVHMVPDLRDGQVHGFVALAVDVTLAKHAEAEVRRADRLMRLAIDAIDAAFVMFDPEDRLVFCNDKYRQLYGGSADLVVPGVPFETLIRSGVQHGQVPKAVGHVDTWVAERVAEHRKDHSEFVQQLADGRSLRVIERRLPDGHSVGFRLDITEQVKAAEAAMAGSRAKSQFLANMSHEIRTPMNAILGLLALLRKTRLDTRQADYTAKTERAARSLLGLLDDILDISKVESGKLKLELHPFQPDQLMRDLAVILAANLGEKPVEILFDIDPDLPYLVEGDLLRLQQVLINLGGNAIKFTERGEVVVSVAVHSRNTQSVRLAFAVVDTGIGVAPENHAHIFSGFSQAEASTTRRFGGTGLGLAISSRLVDMMGGKLELDSDLGKGSRFHFSVDLQLPPQALGGSVPPTEKLQVLVVDDNASARTLLAKLGASLGWTVGAADSARQAIGMLSHAQASGRPWDVVLMDWQMPGTDGWQACQRIRNMQDMEPALVLMVTAHGREALAERGQHSPKPVDGFLIKPFTASMLRDAVHEARLGSPILALPAANSNVADRRLAGLHLLVAEDNATNQLVVRELLEAEGAVVEIVPDGAAAVRAVGDARNNFDAVLMDLQMPVMDGFTATGHIRNELGRTGLPIIAMTANAMASDREACIAAGMNEHVGKPFDMDHLVSVLRTFCAPVVDEPASGVIPRAETATLSPKVLQAAARSGIDIDTALRRMSGNRRILHQLLRGASSDLDAAPDQLRAAAAAGDTGAAAMLLHTLRGQVATLGLHDMAGTLADCEKQLREPAQTSVTLTQRVAPALSAIAASQEGLRALVDSLGQELSRVAAPASAGSDGSELVVQLQALAVQLHNSDMAATDTIAAMRQRFDTTTLDQLQALEEAVNALEFDTALRLCKNWLETRSP